MYGFSYLEIQNSIYSDDPIAAITLPTSSSFA